MKKWPALDEKSSYRSRQAINLGMGQQQETIEYIILQTRATTDQSWNWTAMGQDNTRLPGRVNYIFTTKTCNTKIKQEAIAQVEYTLFLHKDNNQSILQWERIGTSHSFPIPRLNCTRQQPAITQIEFTISPQRHHVTKDKRQQQVIVQVEFTISPERQCATKK